jgi:hypothetical protein
VEERVVRWERNADRLLLRSISVNAVADDSLPIAQSVASNNYAPILGAFPIQAFGRDSASYVLDVTEFFSGDTPALTGLSADARRQYQVRRLDPARSYISTVRSFPMNVEVRHTQTFEAGAPPSDPSGGTGRSRCASRSCCCRACPCVRDTPTSAWATSPSRA